MGHDLAVTTNWTGRNNKPQFSKFKNIIQLITGKEDDKTRFLTR